MAKTVWPLERIEEIVWNDHMGSSGWARPEHYQKDGLGLCRSVGYLLTEDRGAGNADAQPVGPQRQRGLQREHRQEAHRLAAHAPQGEVMPYRSLAQEKWAHTPEGTKKLGGAAKVKEWDSASRGAKLPKRVKPPARRGGKRGS